MLLSSAPHSAEIFSPPISGLRSLLVLPDGGAPGGVVTRALVAASRGCRREGVQESRDGTSIIDGDEESTKVEEEEEVGVKPEAVENVKPEADQEEDGTEEEEEEEEGGFWVSYGRREPRRRLPPPILSLVTRGALRRTRTDDGRLVIKIVPVVRAECTRARRRGGRLTMQLVERDDESAFAAPPLPSPIGAREDGVVVVRTPQEPDADTTTSATGEAVDDDTAAPVPAIGSEGIEDVQEAAPAAPEMRPVVPPPRVPSAGCFEDVFKYSSIGRRSLHQMPSLRMVH